MQQEMTARGQSFQVLVSTIPVYNICALNASQPTHPWHASVRNISFSVGWSCDKASPAKKPSFLFWGFVLYFSTFPFPHVVHVSRTGGKILLEEGMGSGYGK